MEADVAQALESDKTIDITTVGRTSGEQRRIEIRFHNLDGRIFISGQPGRRSWYANLVQTPRFTFHLKGSATAHLAATARPVVEDAERRELLTGILTKLDRSADIAAWMEGSPLVEVTFEP